MDGQLLVVPFAKAFAYQPVSGYSHQSEDAGEILSNFFTLNKYMRTTLVVATKESLLFINDCILGG